MVENSLNKHEKLKSRKAIESLFKYGQTFSSPPLKVYYRKIGSNNPIVKIAVAVPKRTIKKAVDRNKLKRRIREAYRLNKNSVYPSINHSSKGYELLFLYQAGELLNFTKIQASMRFLLHKLSDAISKNQQIQV